MSRNGQHGDLVQRSDKPMPTLRDKVAEHFRSHAGQWIDGRDFERIGGSYGWRTRLSDCRTQLGMQIDNRQSRYQANGTWFTMSEYRYVPADDFQLSA